ncbi:RNA-binding KH domain protein [Medicago truncatula]|uniref:RNA-binding KH domain protein n=2 Tax=Medicago truncatula TaxID=3880 RepID=G7JA56_MEDTR|nr:RNA-binding KH domain protein [Medicago truncatula]
MTAKFDLTSASEPHKMSGATSTTPSSNQKLSKFGAKSGFVIPKNKLLGSLVPIIRGAKKDGVTGVVNEESSKQIERKSRWGPDPTQDAFVRKAKVLALQIRVDQISKMLESENPEIVDTQNSPLEDENPGASKAGSQINSKKSEMLELEKREAIGEILKLDPSYKPPPGFKPLLKEDNVPLPVQEYPGYKFVGLIYGTEGDNQKRLEKETGTKIKIHGTKADTGEKGEIKPGTDVQCGYQEMHVNISADSFDKVDAAISIIELLISSVTGNSAAGSTPSLSVSGDTTNVLNQNKDTTPSHAISLSLENQAVFQPATNTQMQGDHFQYSGSWFSPLPSHTPLFASSGTVVPPNPQHLARAPPFPSQTMSPSSLISAFGAQPPPVSGFHPFIPNQQFSMQAPPPTQILQHSQWPQTNPFGQVGPPRNPSVIRAQNLSAPTNASLSFPVSLSQPTPTGQLQTSVSSTPQPLSGISPSPIANQPLTPHGVSTGLGGGPVNVKMSVGLSNMGPMASPAVPPTRPVSLGPQPDVEYKSPQPNMLMIPRPGSIHPHHAGMSPRPPFSLVPMPGTVHSTGNHLLGPVSFPSPRISSPLPLAQQSGIPTSASQYSHVNPLASMPSNSGNFTFQGQRPNADYYQAVPRPNSQATTQGGTQEPPSGPRPPPFRFAVPDQPLQSFQRTQVSNQLDPDQAYVSAAPFGGSSGSVSFPPRHPAFPYAGQPSPRSQVPQMGMRNFIPAPQMQNLASPDVQRGMHNRQSYPAQGAWPLNQKFSNNPSLASGKPAHPADQIYDPFSPTSAAPPHLKGNPGK